MARLGDELTLSDCQNPHDSLNPIFGDQQVALIEYAFEGYDAAGTGDDLTEDEVGACVKFYQRYGDASKRLEAIFRNVIKNNGTFRP